MKRRVLIVLAVVLLCAAVPVGCGVSRQLAHQRALALAQQIADALGRTPANQIVEFESCGMTDCIYRVYFASPEGSAGMDARVRALSTLHLRVGLASAGGGGDPLLNIMNDDLNRTQIRGRLTVTSSSAYREPSSSYWDLQDEQGKTVGRIWLYYTRDTGVTYLFDGKPLPNANIVSLYTLVSPIQE